MKITVAGVTKEYGAGLTIERLLELEKVEAPLYVTVSVNDEFARREEFAARQLQDGDSVEFLYFMGGGADA